MTTNFNPGGFLCKMPDHLLTLMQSTSLELEKNAFPCLIGTEDYPGEGYRQWKIQVPPRELSGKKQETDFNILDVKGFEPVMDFFGEFVNSIFRFRMSLLAPNVEIKNDSPHEFPRIHIPLSDTDSTFYIEHENIVKSIKLEYGNAYMINVIYFHGVKIDDNLEQRRNAFFSFDRFKDIELNKKFNIN